MIRIILFVFTFVLFALAALRPAHPDASRFVYLGFTLAALAFLLGVL